MKKLFKKIRYTIKDKIARFVMAYIAEEYKHFMGKE